RPEGFCIIITPHGSLFELPEPFRLIGGAPAEIIEERDRFRRDPDRHKPPDRRVDRGPGHAVRIDLGIRRKERLREPDALLRTGHHFCERRHRLYTALTLHGPEHVAALHGMI